MLLADVRNSSVLDDDVLWQEICRLALSLAPTGHPGGSRTHGDPMRLAIEPAGADGSVFEVRTTPIPSRGDAPAVIVVAIEPLRPDDRPQDFIQLRFGLTPRQAEVALLLADRRTTKEIARELGISRHTARRHAEAVLLRLGLNRRTAVRECLEGAAGRAGAEGVTSDGHRAGT